ncbi:MAG: hydroxyectoine utilization dehydratase EutB [Chloroflexota bacterium]|nr:hydroxyectoine utilization dehydratase EutB [Chloroflexota bacterium]
MGERPMCDRSVTLRDVYEARHRISGIAVRTPLIESPALAEHAGAPVYLKLENVQRTGAFKIRGAANKLRSLSSEERERGIITVSSGNHGRAVAYVAQQLGIRATICMSTRVPPNKVDGIRRLGAEVILRGDSYDEASEHALELQEAQRLCMIPPFDDPTVIAGQGTIGLELLEDLPEVDTVIVPLSGGGLLSGIALALKSAAASIRTIGVSMERAPVMFHSLRIGHPIEMEEEETLADALAGGIGLDNRYTFSMIKEYVDETVLVTEEEIADAMAFALQKHRLVVEGGGAVGLASVLHGKMEEVGKNIVVVISGGNVEIPLLLKIAQHSSPSGPR